MMGAGVCATCHDAPPYHDQYPLWAQSAHAKRDLVVEGTVDAMGPFAAHCGRCHVAQGFVAYLDQLNAGNGTQLLLEADGVTPADVPYMTTLGMTLAQGENQSCQVCHDPHSLKLQLEDDTNVLAAGFRAQGVGKGAVCMACHNTRNGLHDDAHAPADYSAPHTPSQTDVLMGQNAYFVSVGEIAGHSAIGDTCVQCHVKLVPASVTAMGSNHTFNADTSICASCHGDGVTGGAQQAKTVAGLATLGTAISASISGVLSAAVSSPGSYSVIAYDSASGWYTATPVSITAAPTAIALEEIHGQVGFTMTLPQAVSYTVDNGKPSSDPGYLKKDITSTTVEFQLGTLLAGATNPVPADSDLVKACWNWFLVDGDGSKSLHNPRYVFAVLDASVAAISP
jgi:hypothetical protein